jgi:type IV secretion system protein VirB10
VALQKRIDIPDTVSVPQGEPIRVFVARDLDFTGVMKAGR